MTVRSVLLPPRAARLAVLPLAWACLGHGQEPSQAGPPIVLARMDRCTPSSALARERRADGWQLVPYETAEFSGTMACAGSYIEAPDLTLSPQVSGWHRVYVGYWNPQCDYDTQATVLRLRLSDQPVPRIILDERTADTQEATYLREAFVDAMDLTGRALVIGKANGVLGRRLYLAYVKLVPLTPGEVASIEAGRRDRSARNLVATIDGMSYFFWGSFRSVADILGLVEPYRHSDVAKVLWAVNYGDRTNYPSRVRGTRFVDRWTRAPHFQHPAASDYLQGEQQLHDTLVRFRDRGVIVQQAVAEHVHRMGLRFDLMFRLGILGQLPRQADGESVLSLYPGCRQVLRDGSVIEKASYAYPEVQGFMLDLIREVTTVIDADGINLCSVRGPHLLCYEAPILEAFQARYQTDARQVEPQDPRLLAVRAGFMTAFMRSTRKVLDEVGAAKGRRLELSVWVWPGNQNVWLGKTPIEEGLDVKGWIQEGLLDSLICQQGVDADYLRLGEQNHCPFILFPGYHGDQAISPRTLTAGYAAGARHFACWDIDCLQVRPEVWPWLRRTGHPDELEAWDPGAHEPRLIRLHRVDGVDVLNGFADAVYSGG